MRTPEQLVALLRNAPPKLRTGDTRIMRRDPEPGRPYFVREVFLRCNCPTCDADGHWMFSAASPRREDVE